MRVDTHVHLVPEGYRAIHDQRELSPMPLPPWDPDMTAAFMDRHRIDAAVMSLAPPGVWFGDAGLAAELARIVNEATAELVRSAPGRYAGLAVLPLPDVDAALAELAYALDVLGLDGVALLSNTGGVYPGDPRVAPVWSELDRRGAYVLLHPAAPAAGPALPEHPIWLYEFPFDTTRAVINLIYSGTLEGDGGLRLQIAHLGGTAPFLAHRIASLAVREPEKAAAAPSGPLPALARCWFDTGLSNHRTAISATADLVPFERIVFGTDWPYAALAESGDPTPELDYLGERRAQLEAENARALVPRLY
ncbi:MAG TPA: amidohydrolase family protein [Solirubrobacteraceae bacterium]|nr:amidohydrolase family protein [Solirubrobacteraceae bacterium]